MFSAHSAESDWEWAKKRRRVFTNPLKDALSGFAIGAVGGWYRYDAGDANWKIALVVSAITVGMAVLLPQIETWLIWRRRHKIRLDEVNEQRRLEQLDRVPAPTPTPPTAIPPAPERPRAEVTFDCDRTGWARLRITNRGAGATFTATIQLHGLLAGAVEGRQIYGKWELGDSPHQRLAAGESRSIRLATVTQIAPGVRAWAVHRTDGDDIKGVDLVELLDVTLVADPDLVDPCAMRVLLNAEGESKMSRLGVDPQLERDVPQRVADMRRLLVEVAEYVRAMSLDGDGVVWMAVTVREKVMKFVGDALGWRMMAVYGRTLKESEQGDVEACAAFLLEKAQRLTEAEISPDFPLPLTWAQYYEAQAGWEWPNMKGFPR